MTSILQGPRENQDRCNEKIKELLKPTQRMEMDKNGEAVLWLRDPTELIETVLSLQKEDFASMDRLSDITAYDNVDGIDGPKRFVAVVNLFSTKHQSRCRIKIPLADGEPIPSLTSIWKMANWLERETYDMYGILYSGHPDLRRIMMDERFVGYPLRKEYPLEERQQFSDSQPLRVIETKKVQAPKNV
jgi:NADH-quinone oxidoreductase subunit C